MSATSSAYSSDDDDALISEINVTPLVDVVLVLLIVLMVTMPTIVSIDLLHERELSVVLPDAVASAPLISTPQELIVNVERGGKYTVLQTPLSELGLHRLLLQAEANNPGRTTVLIRADKNCPWKFVVTVMDLCNQANIRDYRVGATE